MFSNKKYLDFIENSKKAGLDIVEVSVTKTLGSTYAKVGNMMLINSNFETIGVLGSPALHNKFIELAKKAFLDKEVLAYENRPKDKNSGHGVSYYLIQSYFHKDDYSSLGECFSNFGKTRVIDIKSGKTYFLDEKMENKLEDEKFYQSIEKPFSLLIFGSGAHVSFLVTMANLLGWKTTLIDIKLKEEFTKEFDELVILNNLEDIYSMDLNSYDATVILSHSPKTDDKYLEALLKSKIPYIGVLGNKKNMQKKIQSFGLEDSSRFFAPVGLDIGGASHESIALSICSQIEAKRNGKI